MKQLLEEERKPYQPDRLYGNYNVDDNYKGDEEFYILKEILPSKVVKMTVCNNSE